MYGDGNRNNEIFSGMQKTVKSYSWTQNQITVRVSRVSVSRVELVLKSAGLG